MVLSDQLARRGDRLGVVGAVILDHEVDLLAVDAAGVVDLLDFHIERVLLRLAEGRIGPRERDDGADLDRPVARRVAALLAPAGADEYGERDRQCGDEHRHRELESTSAHFPYLQ